MFIKVSVSVVYLLFDFENINYRVALPCSLPLNLRLHLSEEWKAWAGWKTLFISKIRFLVCYLFYLAAHDLTMKHAVFLLVFICYYRNLCLAVNKTDLFHQRREGLIRHFSQLLLISRKINHQSLHQTRCRNSKTFYKNLILSLFIYIYFKLILFFQV